MAETCDDCNDSGLVDRYAVHEYCVVYCECLAGRRLWLKAVRGSIQETRKTLDSLNLQRQALEQQIRKME